MAERNVILECFFELAGEILPAGELLRLGYVVIPLVRDALRDHLEHTRREERIREIEQELLRLRRENALPDTMKDFLVDQGLHPAIAERILQEMAKREAQVAMWNRTLNELLAKGQTASAVRFVESLDLTEAAKSEVVQQIKQYSREREARLAQVERWNAVLHALVQNGRYEDAIRFVQSLPAEEIGETEKSRLIQAIRDRARRQAWGNTLRGLLEERKLSAAVDYLDSLPIGDREKEAIKGTLEKYWLGEISRLACQRGGQHRDDAYSYLRGVPLFSEEEKKALHMALVEHWRTWDSGA